MIIFIGAIFALLLVMSACIIHLLGKVSEIQTMISKQIKINDSQLDINDLLSKRISLLHAKNID